MKKNEEWLTVTQASELVSLTNSGFYGQLTEEYKRKKKGENTMRWKREGGRIYIEKQSVLDYFEGKREC